MDNPCPVSRAVAEEISQRAAKGLTKYGTTVDRKDLLNRDWLQHLFEELLDAAVYTKRVIMELDGDLDS